MIAEIELVNLAPAPHDAPLLLIEQAGGQAEHPGGDRAAFRLIGVEQRVRGAVHDRRQLPAEIIGVLHAGVEALATGRRMDMGRIAGQEHASHPVSIGQPGIHAIGGSPGDVVHDDILAAGPLREQLGETGGRQVDSILLLHRRLDLEQVGADERTDHRLRHRIGGPVSVPGIPIEAVEMHVGDDRAGAERLARKGDAERVADEAAPSVRADQISRT